MHLVGDVLISDEAWEARFGCDLSACLGACCKEGDAGPPLRAGEREAIGRALPGVLAIVRELPGGEAAGEKIRKGPWVEEGRGVGGGRTAHLSSYEDGRCVFTYRALPGSPLQCSLELAYRRGVTGFPKPLFCHLFPLRLQEAGGHRILNIERRPECAPGWDGGAGRVLEFYREALIRALGRTWYRLLQRRLGSARPGRAPGDRWGGRGTCEYPEMDGPGG